jgi:hypothetical protein
MSRYVFESTTEFDPTLKLKIVEENDGRYSTFRYEGFRDNEEAKKFAEWWADAWYWGYMGSAYADGAAVIASRYNSCD